jgi:hypothetical protein
MNAGTLALAATVTNALVCAAVLLPLMLSNPVAAQSNPTMTDVIPDGDNFATQGKIQATDPGASTLTSLPERRSQVPATGTVRQVEQTRLGISPDAAVIVRRVVKLKGPGSFDVVNPTGGGIYAIKTTDPSRKLPSGC